jgi:hypothetical protein
MSPRSSIGCHQYYFRAYRTFDSNHAPILLQEYHYLQMDRTELPLETGHLGVPSSASKMISNSMVCSAQIMHLSCTNTNTVSKWTKTRFRTTHVTFELHRVCPKLFMSLWFVPRKPCTCLVSRLALPPNGPNIAPMVHLTQTEHLSCTDANTVSKQIETRFHMTHITSEFHQVPPILFLRLWYVLRKPCTNLASRVALFPNGPN